MVNFSHELQLGGRFIYLMEQLLHRYRLALLLRLDEVLVLADLGQALEEELALPLVFLLEDELGLVLREHVVEGLLTHG